MPLVCCRRLALTGIEPEYLGLLDELLECRDDVSLHLIQNQLKQLIDRENCGLAEIGPLIECYKRSIMTFHVHGFLRQGSQRSFKRSLRRSGIDFCATIQSRISSGAQPTGISNTLVLPNTRTRKIQTSVL